MIYTHWLPCPSPSHCRRQRAVTDQAVILESRILVHQAFEVVGTAHLVPYPRIDRCVQEIGYQVSEDDAEDHGSRFIHQEPWRASVKAVSPRFQDLPKPYL